MTANPSARRRLLLVCPENLSPREAALARQLTDAGEVWIIVASPDALGAEPPAGGRVLSRRALGRMRRGWTPDFIVYASPPASGWHWRMWWWKRRRASAALFGGYWQPAPSEQGGRWQRWKNRWAQDSLDFWFADTPVAAGALQRAGVPAGRVLVTGGPAASPESVPDFLERRRRAEERSVLWVDEDINLHSPSTKHFLYSLPLLREEGWEVRGWCLNADATAHEGTEVREFAPVPAHLRLFTPYWFFALANLHGLAHTLLKGCPPARLVHTVGGAFLGADLVSIQFVNHVWLWKQIALRPRSLKEAAMIVLTALGACKDQLQFSNPRCRVFLPASDSIGEEVRRRCLPGAVVWTLANSYDETRFNPAVRQQWREPMRRELGLAGGDTVFSFASQGHYKRKGFWLAAEALARLRRRENLLKARGVKFLVIGGYPKTLEQLQGELALRYPDWKEWIIFVGSQPAVERYLSAADGFLFPSYFEAFCLAEIEAGALGLPLLLTPHPGTEMILQDGVNGLRLSFDQTALTEAVGRFLEQGLPPFAASAGRGLNRSEYARALARDYARCLEE